MSLGELQSRSNGPEAPSMMRVFPSGTVLTRGAQAFYAESNSNMNLKKVIFADSYREHVDSSRKLILDSAQGLKGDALIIGIGSATEIPLKELINQFGSVTAVDIDGQALERNAAFLSEQEKKRFRMIVEDVSGMSGELFKFIRNTLDESQTATEYLQKLLKGLPQVRPQEVNLGTDYHFVVSSLVLSQLAAQPFASIQDALKQKYGIEEIDLVRMTEQYGKEKERMEHSLTDHHLGLLHSSVAKNGQVYFADHKTMNEARHDRNGNLVYIEPFLLGYDNVEYQERRISEKFVVEKKRDWNWLQTPPNPFNYGVGSLFSIRGYSLSPLWER